MNIRYEFPISVETRIYDFYFLTGYGLTAQYHDPMFEFSVKDMIDDFVDDLTEHLRMSVKFSVSVELRHMFDGHIDTCREDIEEWVSGRAWQVYRKFEDLYEIAAYNRGSKERNLTEEEHRLIGYSDSASRRHAFTAMLATQEEMFISDKELAELAYQYYSHLTWRSAFGGDAWAKVARGLTLILNAETLGQKIVACDHVYDLVHNGGPAVDKVELYNKEARRRDNGMSFLRSALSFKRDAPSAMSFLGRVSPELNQLVHYVSRVDPNYNKKDFFNDQLRFAI